MEKLLAHLSLGSWEKTLPMTEIEGEPGPYAAHGCQVVLGIGTPRFVCSQLEPAIGHTAGMSRSKCAINNRRYCGIDRGGVFSGNGGAGSQWIEQ